MALASENASSLQSWNIETERRVAGLEVVLLKQTYVLPWSQFLYAEGSFNQLRAVFTTHDVFVTGTGLSPLVSAFAAQHITRLLEPARADKFSPAAVPRITTLTVKSVDPRNSCTSMARNDERKNRMRRSGWSV